MDNLTYLDHRIEKIEDTLKEFKDTLKELKDTCTKLGQDTPKTKPKTGDKEDFISEIDRKKVYDVLKNFDFEKVQKIMTSLDWKWCGTLHGVPTVDEIKALAHRLLVDAIYENTTIATGGLRATYESKKDEDDVSFLSLEFIVEEWEGVAEDEDGE